ncbi:MAG: hypothetical protein R3B39_02125 [Candidatus Paceibacterota bacterium]
MKKDVILKMPVVRLNIVPYALARLSEDFLGSSNNYHPKTEIHIVNFYLLCVSIELGLKSILLSKGYSKKKIKNFGHDLIKLVKEYNKINNLNLEQKVLNPIEKINPYFKNKSMEYFKDDFILSILRGYKDLPSIKDLSFAANQINKIIKKEKYFINIS